MKLLVFPFFAMTAFVPSALSAPLVPAPKGKLVSVGGFRIHLDCSGKGSPTVVIENGFDEFSTDWQQVQQGISAFTRVCTYDRAGYAWSELGPMPRTYAQINLDLHNALLKAGERMPLILVGHSFGGPVVRSYALTYREDVAGLVFAESVGESHRIVMGTKTARLVDFAQHRQIPPPRSELSAADANHEAPEMPNSPSIEPPFDRLSSEQQRARLWALSQPALQVAEASEREWSPEYFALWIAKDQTKSLGDLPVEVLARAEGGFDEGLDVSAQELEKERRAEQSHLAALSSRGKLTYVAGGHEIEIDAPGAVVEGVRSMVIEWRHDKEKQHNARESVNPEPSRMR